MNAKLIALACASLCSVACGSTSEGRIANVPATTPSSHTSNNAPLRPSHTANATQPEATSTTQRSAHASGAVAEPADLKWSDIEAQCAGRDQPCTPPAAVAKQLCSELDANLALTMFRRGTPWRRVYSRADMEAWYAAKGRTRPRQIRYAEEMIVLVDRTDAGKGMQVSGFGNYDVYRWDGSCVSMMADEVTKFRPSTPDLATIPWQQLAPATQDALLSNKPIAFRHEKRQRACHGVDGRHSDACQFATHDLSRMIAMHIWSGGDVPIARLLR